MRSYSTLVMPTFYYDVPKLPQRLFDDFLKIPAVSNDAREMILTTSMPSLAFGHIHYPLYLIILNHVPLLRHSKTHGGNPKRDEWPISPYQITVFTDISCQFWGQTLSDKFSV